MTTEIKQFSKIESDLDRIEEECPDVPDVKTSEGFDKGKKIHRELRKFSTTLEKARKKLVEPPMTKIKIINAAAKEISSRLDEIATPFKIAIDDRKKELMVQEQERVNGLRNEILGFRNFVNVAIGKSSIKISEVIESVDLIEVDEYFQEFQAKARETLNETKSKLAEMLSVKIQSEINDKRLAEEQAEKDKLQAENDRIKKEADEKKAALVTRNKKIIEELMMGFDYLITDVDDLVEMDTYDLSELLKKRLEDEKARLKSVEEAEEPLTSIEESGEISKETWNSLTTKEDEPPKPFKNLSCQDGLNHSETERDIKDCVVCVGEWFPTKESIESLVNGIDSWAADCEISDEKMHKLYETLAENGVNLK